MQWPGKEKLFGAGMSDYLAKPIEEERLHNLLLRYKPSGIFRVVTPEVNEIVVNRNDPRLATGTTPCSKGNRFSARYAAMLLISPEVRNKVEEQLVGKTWKAPVDLIHKLHGSCGYMVCHV